jgi:hypothetical protein
MPWKFSNAMNAWQALSFFFFFPFLFLFFLSCLFMLVYAQKSLGERATTPTTTTTKQALKKNRIEIAHNYT